MSQAAPAGDRRPRRREVETWADDLDILGGLGEDKSADWTVLTLEREQPSEGEVAEVAGRCDPSGRSASSGQPHPSGPEVAGQGGGQAAARHTPKAAADRRILRGAQAAAEGRVVRDAHAAAEGRVLRGARAAAEGRMLHETPGDAGWVASHGPQDPSVDGLPAVFDAAEGVAAAEGAALDADGSARRDSGGRRTVVIRGQAAAPRAVVPSSERRRPAPRTRDRLGSNPDRIAMWAVGLGVLLIVIAAITAGG
jgi:hypothetical protein